MAAGMTPACRQYRFSMFLFKYNNLQEFVKKNQQVVM